MFIVVARLDGQVVRLGVVERLKAVVYGQETGKYEALSTSRNSLYISP